LSYLLVFLGGGLGSCARYGIAKLLGEANTQFPIATLLANILACAALGYGLAQVAQLKMQESHKLLLLTGFCGGFSTFSTFSAEALQLWTDGRPGMAFAYVAISIFAGVGIIWWLTK